MTSRYVDVHKTEALAGPGDARPTALQIIEYNDLIGKWSDKVVLVTGCSSGIGVDTVHAMKATGAKVYACVRNVEKAKRALKDIIFNDGKIEILELDLSSLDSIRECAAEFLKKESKLNILINNAGVMMIPKRELTKDGFELQFGSNHLGPFLLFQLLKPALLKGSTPELNSRVVNVSSMGHRSSPTHLDDLNLGKPGAYTPAVGYGNSKTANIYMANEIERRYGSKGLHAWSLHPGGIETGLQIHSDEILEMMKKPEIIRIMKNTAQGAATSVLAAVDKELEGKGGKYLDDCAVALPVGEEKGGSGGYADYAYDEESAKELWRKSCELCKIEDE